MTHYDFDDNGHLVSLDHRLGASSLRSYGYTYDANGMRASMTDVEGTHDYVYDQLYQIVEATHPTVSNPLEQFEYDPVGNWLGDARVHNELNQLVEDDSCWYQYDADGNMTLRLDKVTGDSTVYTWDIENRLTRVDMPSGTVVEYVYGPLGRRLAKVVDGERKEFRYDGEDLIMEMNSRDSVVASYTFGPGIDQPLAMNRGGRNYYYLADGLGSITAITDSTGNVLQEYTYSVFGEIVEQSADSIENAFAFTGREWDGEVGLYYYRARYYDPGLGRFLSEDPVGFYGLDLNLYSYAWNEPSQWSDPSGLAVIAHGLTEAQVARTQKMYAQYTRQLTPEGAATLYAMEQSDTKYYVQFAPEKQYIQVTPRKWDTGIVKGKAIPWEGGAVAWFSDYLSFAHEVLGHFPQYAYLQQEKGYTEEEISSLTEDPNLRKALEEMAQEIERREQGSACR